MKPPDLNQIDLVVRDMDASIAFYRALGVDIPESAIWRTATGAHHVDLTMPGGLILYFDSPALARAYDRGWHDPSGSGHGRCTVCSSPARWRTGASRNSSELIQSNYPR